MNKNTEKGVMPYERHETETLEMTVEIRFLDGSNEPIVTDPEEDF